MRGILVALGVAVLLLSACAPAKEPAGSGRLTIDRSEMLLLESFPVQVQLSIHGTRSTCDRLDWDVRLDEVVGRMEVRLWAEPGPALTCLPGETVFDESIPLGSFEVADLEVFLNEESIGRIDLP
jgi:hypothetical protein